MPILVFLITYVLLTIVVILGDGVHAPENYLPLIIALILAYGSALVANIFKYLRLLSSKKHKPVL